MCSRARSPPRARCAPSLCSLICACSARSCPNSETSRTSSLTRSRATWERSIPTERQTCAAYSSPLASGIGFSLAQVAIGDGIHTSHVVWDSAPVTVTASEALWAAADAAKNHAARDEAEGFLKDALAAGAALAQDVKEKASAADISERTLRRARKSLGIIVTKDGYQGKTQWSLPNES